MSHLILLLGLGLCANVGLAYISVNPLTKFFVDENGRSMLYHGVNAVFKVPPFYPRYDIFDSNSSLCAEDARNLKEWGFNFVRLYVAWPGVEPGSKGKYDVEYLNHLEAIIGILKAEGIVTLLDCHQDVLSPFFCGEGIPDSYVDPTLASGFPFPLPFPLSKDPKTGKPLISDCLKRAFAEYYPTLAVGETFQMLYTSGSELREAFLSFWKEVASRFANETSVMGYELINEPYFGNVWKYPEYLIPGRTDKEFLVPLYRDLFTVIDGVDRDHMVFFEPVVADLGPSGFSGCPFESPSRCVFAYHVYCGIVGKKGEPVSRVLCDLMDDFFIDTRNFDAQRIGGGKLVTEFGAVYNDSKSVTELNWLVGELEKRLTGWAFWQFKYYYDYTTADRPAYVESFYDAQGNLQETKVRALSRTYAQATCGIPLVSIFDPESNEYVLRFQVTDNDCNGAPTVIYLNEAWHYPQGYRIQLTPTSAGTIRTVSKNYLHFFLDYDVVKSGDTVEIGIAQT